MDDALGVNAKFEQERLEKVADDGLADPAQSEAGEGDPELAGAQVGVEVRRDVFGKSSAPIAGCASTITSTATSLIA